MTAQAASVDLAAAAGRFVFAPRAAQAIQGGRPVVEGAMLDRLVAGRRAAVLPDLLAALFSLCSAVQRLTARRAVRAALGAPEGTSAAAAAASVLRAATLRDQLQRLALDLPQRVPAGVDVPTAWLAGAPVMQAAATTFGRDDELAAALPRMADWLERHLLGAPPGAWWRRWQADPEVTARDWALREPNPVARWHAAVLEPARAIAWPCRPLDLLDGAPEQVHSAMRRIAAALSSDPGFAARPHWRGLSAETGAWTRCTSPNGMSPSAWLRLAARIADIVRIAGDEAALRHGALALGDGAGIAWCEMARGLLVHWVRLEPGSGDPSLARVQACRVLAPTEWNFHPDGAFARWLGSAACDARAAALAATALDPCVEFEVCGLDPARELAHA